MSQPATAPQAAVQSASAGDLDDSAFEVAKGHGRYEVEEYHVEDNLGEALRLIDAGRTSDARAVILGQVRILRTGRPGAPRMPWRDSVSCPEAKP